MAVEQDFAAWLKSANDTAKASDAVAEGKWGVLAASSEIASPFAERAPASAEAARQLAFLSQPMVTELIIVPGLRIDLIGKRIDVSADRAGLSATRCIVIGAEELPDVEMTQLKVLRRLGT